MSGPEAERENDGPAASEAWPVATAGDPGPRGRLVSTGGLLADLVVRVDAVPARGEDTLARGFTQTVGGSFATMAAAARLGMSVALAGALGDDAIGEAGRSALAAESVELLLPEPRPGGSGVCLVMVDAGGERTMVTVEGVESRLAPEDFAAIRLRPGDVVYVSGYDLLYPHGPALVDWVVTTRPERLVFDPAPLVASIPADLLAPILATTTWLSLNATEAHSLTGTSDPQAAAASLLRRLRVDGPIAQGGVEFSARQHARSGGVVMRDGAAGALVLAHGSEPVAVAAFPAEVVDTTGAGDTHVGAFVAALARGLDPVEACRWGNAAAARVVAAGGQVSPPRLDELRRILGTPQA